MEEGEGKLQELNWRKDEIGQQRAGFRATLYCERTAAVNSDYQQQPPALVVELSYLQSPPGSKLPPLTPE